jgi:hypothetical protein
MHAFALETNKMVLFRNLLLINVTITLIGDPFGNKFRPLSQALTPSPTAYMQIDAYKNC